MPLGSAEAAGVMIEDVGSMAALGLTEDGAINGWTEDVAIDGWTADGWTDDGSTTGSEAF